MNTTTAHQHPAARAYVLVLRVLTATLVLGVLFVALCSRSTEQPDWCPINTTSDCVDHVGSVTR